MEVQQRYLQTLYSIPVHSLSTNSRTPWSLHLRSRNVFNYGNAISNFFWTSETCMRYSGAKECIISDQPNPRKQSSNTEVFRWGLGTPEVPWNILGGGSAKLKLFLHQCWDVICFFTLVLWCGVFQKLHETCLWFSDTNQVSNDWTQFWHWLLELVWTSQIKNSVPWDCPFQMYTTNGVPGDPHFCSAGYRFGGSYNLPCPFWQCIRTTQKTQENPLLASTSLLQSLQLRNQKRCTGEVCTHSFHALFRNTPFTTLIGSSTRQLLKPI